MKLGTGENLVKQYDYYHTSNGNKEAITVTNRRIVATHTDAYGESREEIRVCDVKSVDSGYHRAKNYNFKWLLLSLIGLFLLIVGATEEEMNVVLVLVGVAAVVLGFVLLFATAKLAQHFYVSINTDMGEGKAIHSNVSTAGVVYGASGKTKKTVARTQRKVTVYIEESVVTAIMDELGGVILELQA